MNNKIIQISLAEWKIFIRFPEILKGAPVTLMLHGWTGDEKSMWSFKKAIPENHIVIAPRGLYPSNHAVLGGFSWASKKSGKWSFYKDFLSSVEKLHNLVDLLSQKYDFAVDKINLIGFSQGAACAYTYLMEYPLKVKSIAGLSGFLPINPINSLRITEFNDHHFFISHGIFDETVPLEMADKSEKFFKSHGAKIISCRSEVKHKLSSDCMKMLQSFYRK